MKKNHSPKNQIQDLVSPSLRVATPHSGNDDILMTPSRKDISLKAYFSFEREGSKSGNELYHWLEAEADLLAQCKKAGKNGF